MDEIKKKVIEIMEEVGVFIDGEVSENELNSYFDDSIHFMSFVVQLESEFQIEFPNEFLVFDSFNSLDNIAEMISQLLERS